MLWYVAIIVTLLLLERIYRMSATPAGLAALTQAVTDLTNAVSGVSAELTKLIAELKAAIAASAASEDASVLAAAQNLETQITALNTAVSGAVAADPNTPATPAT
jgi:hypothetical protein